MIRGHGRGSSSVSSRSSLHSVGFMPVIAENEVAQSHPSTPKPVVAHLSSTPISLRVPQKSPRRPSPRGSPRGLPPPYVPPYILVNPPALHPPPCYKESDGESPERDARMRRGEYGGRRNQSDRWCCIVGVGVAILVVLAVGLAVGLTIGLQDKDPEKHTQGSDSPDQSFPAGSFSFEVDLQETSTNCTSNTSTWRCYPYTTGDSATFFWVITADSSSAYTISSTENPFAPSFTNRSLAVLDAGKPTERLRFFYSMSKEVVPSENLTSNNRAATCTFDETRFEATLWTRRRGNDTVDPASDDIKFGAWPGDAEIVQSKSGTLGPLKCEDSNGNRIGNVQAKPGTCECRYSNIDV
ncbi:hypothetical protein EDB81DRAFT_447944 [Dactylonectria macrodidyma]|uniref:Tat pathway signal sequence n=1 Tax=Dactylonectria macrodidyma TaxID=307937 RepID=A0A9P9JB67_9HYPO|nr:hypothetical protein EDB81DRAFT_447944 [Dactylonectria macrodidyma]